MYKTVGIRFFADNCLMESSSPGVALHPPVGNHLGAGALTSLTSSAPVATAMRFCRMDGWGQARQGVGHEQREQHCGHRVVAAPAGCAGCHSAG